MKKLLLVLALVSIMSVVPMYGNAGIIGDVTITETAGGNAASVYFSSIGNWVNALLQYNVSVNGGPSYIAFCVEGMYSPGPDAAYTNALG